MKNLEVISPAAYFCLLRKPHFLSSDRLGVDDKFYLTPANLPSGENPLTVVMKARGRYPLYQFGSRHLIAAMKARRESTGRESSPPSAPPSVELEESVPDLRALIPPKKADLRETINRKPPQAPRKESKLSNKHGRSYTGPGAWVRHQGATEDRRGQK